MSFVRRKVIKGRTYLYEVENYRDPETGKVKQRTKQYIGRDPEDVARQQAEKLGTTEKPGWATRFASLSTSTASGGRWRERSFLAQLKCLPALTRARAEQNTK